MVEVMVGVGCVGFVVFFKDGFVVECGIVFVLYVVDYW